MQTTMKIEKTFHFLAGLPRSGSTVLQSILSQNPDIYASATSPMMDMLFHTEQAWINTTQSATSGSVEQLNNIYAGVINGLYYHVHQPIVIDKHRAWARNLQGISQFFPNGKCICTVRSIPEIIASFVVLTQKQKTVSYIDRDIIKLGKPITTENRANIIWNNYVQNTWESLKIGYEYNKENLLLIEYDDLVNKPNTTFQKIYEFINIPHFQHTYISITNKTPERDEHWGLDGLHEIRSTLTKTSKSAIKILGQNVYDKYTGLEFWRL